MEMEAVKPVAGHSEALHASARLQVENNLLLEKLDVDIVPRPPLLSATESSCDEGDQL